MSDAIRSVAIPGKRLSISELRKLPLKERNAILEAQAILAEPIYRPDVPHICL
jgi:hypothetical protein